jgi:ATP-binding cassette subfamily F protein uup
MPLVNLINAGYRYPGTDRWVFRRFDMVIEPGEVVRVTGRNGTGKSTLLKVLSGILEPTEGELRNHSGAKIAYMDQFSGEMLARDLTIAEQFKAAAAPGIAPGIAPMEMLIQFELGLQDRVKEFIGHLSGGQRQIIALLCTLAAGASVLCLDEFTSSMDEYSVQVADKLLAHAKVTANVALILVSHGGTTTQTDRELDVSTQGVDDASKNR